MKENENIILFNTLTGKFVKFDSKYKDELNQSLSGFNSGKIFKYLINERFIIPGFEDEDEKVRELEQRSRRNNQQLSIIIMPTERCNFRCEYCYEINRRDETRNHG